MMRRLTTALAAALLLLAPAASRANLLAYSQDFETLVLSDPAALSSDGWLVYGNVFSLDHSIFYYGYGPFPAPNPGGGFSAIDAGQGGLPQGAQQLSIYSDYNNLDHANGRLIESNVFHEQTIAAANTGTKWSFVFDAKLGNLTSPSTALAFIKTLDPAHGYALTNFITVDMTAIPASWAQYALSIDVVSGLAGQILQFGFANTTTNYVSSGVFYDNILWGQSGILDVAGGPRPKTLELRSAAPNPFTSFTRVDFTLVSRGDADISVYDIAGRHVATLFHGPADAGPHAATWDGRSADGRLAPTGVYRCVLRTATGREAKNLVLNR